MKPSNKSELQAKAPEIGAMSRGRIQLVKLKPLRKGAFSNLWVLYIDGELIQEMRPPRAMSFLDGFLLASAMKRDPQTQVISFTENANSPQIKDFTTREPS